MGVIQIALFIIILILLFVAFRNAYRLKGGVYTSWVPFIGDSNNELRHEIKEAVNLITDAYQKQKNDKMTYVLSKMKFKKNVEHAIEHLIVELDWFENKAEITSRTLNKKGVFEAIYITLVEAYLHLYLIHDIQLKLSGDVGFGSFNLVINCIDERTNKEYALRMRARPSTKGSAKIVNYYNYYNGETSPIKFDEKIVKEEIEKTKEILEIFKDSKRVIKPICSSYNIYQSYNDEALLTEWSLSDRCYYVEPNNINDASYKDYVECILEVASIAHKHHLYYYDWKLPNILFNPVTNGYCVVDIDFKRPDEYPIVATHYYPKFESYLGEMKQLYIDNYIIWREAYLLKNYNKFNDFNEYAKAVRSACKFDEERAYNDDEIKNAVHDMIQQRI